MRLAMLLAMMSVLLIIKTFMVDDMRIMPNVNTAKYFLDPDLKLAACGDWCLGGRIEGAFTSAYNLVNTMKECVL